MPSNVMVRKQYEEVKMGGTMESSEDEEEGATDYENPFLKQQNQNKVASKQVNNNRMNTKAPPTTLPTKAQ